MSILGIVLKAVKPSFVLGKIKENKTAYSLNDVMEPATYNGKGMRYSNTDKSLEYGYPFFSMCQTQHLL